MMMRIGVVGVCGERDVAQEQTVAALRKDGFAVAGLIPSAAGPGLFLQQDDRLIFCVVAETSSAADLATRCCKPVR